MSIYRIFMKLMTQHLVSHLIVPMVLGVTVEIVVAWLLAWRHGLVIYPWEYLISPERVGLYAGIIITYLIIAGWFVQKQGRAPWQRTEMMKLDRILSGAKSVFATSTLSLKAWFEPYNQQYFSHILRISSQLKAFEFVLLFSREHDLENAKIQYLDGQYAKPLAEIHKNYGITLAFLSPGEFRDLETKFPGIQYDFLFIKRESYQLDKVVVFRKRGRRLVVEELEGELVIGPYRRAMEAIRFRALGSHREPNPDHDFHATVS